MRSNPFRLTLAILGIGLLALGLLLWLIGSGSRPADTSGVALLLQAFGPILMGVGWLPFLAWLIVGALQWRPARAEHALDEPDDDGPRQSMSEYEIRARMEKKGS
jgi:hypothetical protein